MRYLYFLIAGNSLCPSSKELSGPSFAGQQSTSAIMILDRKAGGIRMLHE